MKVFKLTLAIAIAFMAVSYVDGTTASAANRYSTGAGTDWFTAANWNTQADGSGSAGVPAADDDVFIQANDEIKVEDITASVDTVTVQTGGTLSMYSVGGGAPTTGILLVEESITVTGTGIFRFNESTDATPIVRANGGGTTTPVTLDGAFTVPGTQGATFDANSTHKFHLRTGSIVSGGAILISAPIENDATITASSGNITISGAVCAGSTGTFTASGGNMTFSAAVENDGTIEATGGDVLFSGTIAAGSTGSFKVTAASSDMDFNMSASAAITPGDADFSVSAGRMLFRQTLSTTGGFKQTGGKIEAAAGKSFTATGAF